MKAILATVSVILLAITLGAYQEASAIEQSADKSANDPLAKLQEYKNSEISKTDTKAESKNAFINEIDWLFSIILPDGWDDNGSFPFYFASAQTNANQIFVDRYVSEKQGFAGRDDFHSYMKETEYLVNHEFGLGNSITTIDTDYGYKTMIVLKFTTNDGSQMMIRKDFHFVNKNAVMYYVHGVSSDVISFNSLKRTLDTFSPIV
jgi:hypothetical protein